MAFPTMGTLNDQTFIRTLLVAGGVDEEYDSGSLCLVRRIHFYMFARICMCVYDSSICVLDGIFRFVPLFMHV